jgi:phosphomevalonate kinase
MVEGIQEWEETVGLVRKLRQWRERDDVQERGE